MDIYFSKEQKNHKHLKPTYLSNHFLNLIFFYKDAIIQKKIYQIMVKEACLQIIVFEIHI
jgi:hypothetical protein